MNVVTPGFVHRDVMKDLKEEPLKKNSPLWRFREPIDVACVVVFLLRITMHYRGWMGGL